MNHGRKKPQARPRKSPKLRKQAATAIAMKRAGKKPKGKSYA
tara:strand:+ start:488 stop:613 length:126 start_codon:yes stop_codon:yes gene_type:complete